MENYLLLFAGAFYLLGVASLFLKPRFRRWMWACGSIVFTLVLSGLALLPEVSMFSDSVKVKITNYSSRSGTLYFLKKSDGGEKIFYDLAVNRNEASSFEVEGEVQGFDAVWLLSKGDFFQVPVPEQRFQELEVWEKELKPVNYSVDEVLEKWQQRQQLYSLAVGLMLFWFVLHLFILRRQKEQSLLKEPVGKR